jgi:murein DD-endopeptidase MepM/ murein hydrolase activator NlpD
MTEKVAVYKEPFPKNKRGDEFKNFASYRTNPHRGVDWSVPAHSKIKAITGGTIMEVKWTNVLGNIVIQSTYDKHFILYAHLAKPTELKVGDKVEAGVTLIGEVGGGKDTPSGTASTGSHLHVTYGTQQDLVSADLTKLNDLFAKLDGK